MIDKEKVKSTTVLRKLNNITELPSSENSHGQDMQVSEKEQISHKNGVESGSNIDNRITNETVIAAQEESMLNITKEKGVKVSI